MAMAIGGSLARAITMVYVAYGLTHMFMGRLPDQWYIALLYFIMLKMIFNYDKCTLSYIECRLRGVPKERGYLNTFVRGFLDLRDQPVVCSALVCYTVVFSIYYFKSGGRLVV